MALTYFIGMALLSLLMFCTECVETDHRGQVLGDKTRLIRLPCFQMGDLMTAVWLGILTLIERSQGRPRNVKTLRLSAFT